MADRPPPLPPVPAGLWWRTFAALADVVPLLVLSWWLAVRLAGPDEQTALTTVGAFYDQLRTLSLQSQRTGSTAALWDLALHPPEATLQAYALWLGHLGTVSFCAVGGALTAQEWLGQGRTLGKRIFRLRSIDVTTGEAPGFLPALLRSAWKTAFLCLPNPFFTLLGIVNAHVPLFRKDRRAWHDLWTRTQVVEDDDR
ncbi:MAG: RDD family protein [Opitutia bacterium]